MKRLFKIRKLLCICSVFLIFFVSNSFLYESLEINADSLQTGEEAVLIEDVETIEDRDLLTEEERQDYGDVDETEMFTLDDVMETNRSLSETDFAESTEEETETDIHFFDPSDWKLLLINKQHAIPEDYEVPLGTIKGSMKCDERIIPELTEMMQAARADGVNLVICSPYRDYDRQIMLFNRKIKAYMKRGMSYLEAYRVTSQAVTVPGASEHQIGLALDIISDKYSSLNEGFGDTEAGKWLASHSYEHGFILRYPAGKEDITGIEYEPWHFRYVGKAAARYIYDNELTLEEFVSLLVEA